jgi:quinol monooxygenase YgiN
MSGVLKIVARIVAAPDAAETLEVAMKKLVLDTREEAGCLRYDLYRDKQKLGVFVFLEQWETPELWQSHISGAAVKAFNENTGGGKIASGEIMQLEQIV